MLEVRNLYKEYKIKNNKPVVVLNHINLKFPDKGLVFILGKSTSGKSTLLNVMGGLDKADEGEIIINNVSSRNFYYITACDKDWQKVFYEVHKKYYPFKDIPIENEIVMEISKEASLLYYTREF